MYLLSLNSLCLHSLACIKPFPPVSYPFWQSCLFSREYDAKITPFSPLFQTILSVISSASPLEVQFIENATLFLSYALSLSFPCIFCRYFLVLFHCFYPRRIKVFPHPLGKGSMGFLSLPYYILLGWTYWLLVSSPFFFIGFFWATFVGSYLTLSLLGFSRPILLFKKGHSTPMHYPSLKEGLWAHFGLLLLLFFLFSTNILSFSAIAWATFVCFLTFRALGVWPSYLFFAHTPTHSWGWLGHFSSLDLWAWIRKNRYQ